MRGGQDEIFPHSDILLFISITQEFIESFELRNLHLEHQRSVYHHELMHIALR